MNPAGDSMRSIADSLGLSKVLKYLEDLGSGLKGECVVTDMSLIRMLSVCVVTAEPRLSSLSCQLLYTKLSPSLCML